MNLTRAGEYAVRCVLYLSTQDQQRVVKRVEVAEAMEIPGHFLGKIAQRLARAEILEITQGARGGYRLLRPPRRISLLDVIVAAEGNMALNQCLIRPGSCNRSDFCAVHQVWHQAREALLKVLQEADFATLARHELQISDHRRRKQEPTTKPSGED